MAIPGGAGEKGLHSLQRYSTHADVTQHVRSSEGAGAGSLAIIKEQGPQSHHTEPGDSGSWCLGAG